MSDPKCKHFSEWDLKCHQGNYSRTCVIFADKRPCGYREDQTYMKAVDLTSAGGQPDPLGPVTPSAMQGQVGGDHYKNMKIQPAEFCQKNLIPWCEANAIKYACRHKTKNGIEDLKKAIHYLRLCAKMEYDQEI